MDLKKILDNLQDSRELIARYADLDNNVWKLKFYIQNYNRNRLFIFLSLIPTLILIYVPKIPFSAKSNLLLFLVVSVVSFIILRYGFFAVLDHIKRKALWRKKQPELTILKEEMNRLSDKLDSFTVLPPKYRTLHAAETIENYILNNRIDSLKEGLNLYEGELFKAKQIQNQKIQIQQNHMMMQQNDKMIDQNKKLIRAVRNK